MGLYRFYLAPAKEQIYLGGNDLIKWSEPFYDEIEITSYVIEDSLSSIKQNLGDPKHLGGILSFDNFNLQVNNDLGEFHIDLDGSTFFPYKIKNSKIRIIWEEDDKYPICGSLSAICGDTYLTRLSPVFEGIIIEDPIEGEVDFKILRFQVLGYLSLIREYGRYTHDPVSDNNSHSVIFQIFLPLLEKGIITQEDNLPLLSDNFDDYFNFARDYNQPEPIKIIPPEDEDKNLDEILEDMLKMTGGYIFFTGDKYFFRNIFFDPVRPNFKFECHNQHSNEGVENICNITLKNEFDRVFSKIIWNAETPYATPPFHALEAGDSDLVGIKELDIDFEEYIDNTVEADKIMENYVEEFKIVRIGVSVKVPVTIESLLPNFLESIKIVIPYEGSGLTQEENILSGIVLGKEIDMKKEEIRFYLRIMS